LAEGRERNDKNFSLCVLCDQSAEGETRTPMARAATPSRWCVYQFHHFGIKIFYRGVRAERRE